MIFISAILLSISFASAYCSMPSAYRENGAGLDLISGIKERRLITIEQTDHPSDSWVNYNLQVKNKNSVQGILVYLESITSQGNIQPSSIMLGPGEKGNLSLNVWVRQDKDVKFRFTGICDDGTRFDNFINPVVEFEVDSYESIAPDNGCNPPISGCDMNTGLFTSYYCNGSEVKSMSKCVPSCCQAYAQQFDDNESFCSVDKHACISSAGIEPTEGSIAFMCNSDECKYEKDIMLTLRLLGWKVDGKSYKNWLEGDFDNYDIIACYNQAACNARFNSPAYNQHVVNRKPFLEIAMSRSAPAAYEFGYLTKSGGSSGRDMLFVTAQDGLTDGFYNSSVNVVSKYRPSFAVFKDEYLDTANNPELTDLANSGYNLAKNGSIFFKVDETVGHGKYVFIGWLTGFKKGELNYNGDVILRRTLNWLKNTTPIGPRKEIAFICSKDVCSDRDEMGLIKMFRRWGFLVNGKSLDSWGNETNDYDLIVCRNSRASCQIPLTSPVYGAHLGGNVSFLEIPETSKAYAAELFGHVSSRYRRMSNFSIQINTSDPIVSGFDTFINIFDKRRPIIGIEASGLNSAKDIAHVSNLQYSTLFTTQSSGKYAFIGWMARSNIQFMNENGKELLHRTVDWLTE